VADHRAAKEEDQLGIARSTRAPWTLTVSTVVPMARGRDKDHPSALAVPSTLMGGSPNLRYLLGHRSARRCIALSTSIRLLNSSPMPNIANILKLEISRISRKEIRGEVQSLKKAVASYRSEIAALKTRAKQLEAQVSQIGKAHARTAVTPEEQSAAPVTRVSAKALAAQRRRLKLSADQLGLLIGVSGQSVYNWEQGTAPHPKHVSAIAALKSLSVRQAQELAELRRS